MVTITSDISENRYTEIISVIRKVVLSTPSLTPRSKSQLETALKLHHLAVAYDSDTIIGWLIATPYTPTTQELGMAYVMPKYRDTGILKNLIGELIDKQPVSIAVTYEIGLQRSLMKHWGFEPSTLYEFVRVSNGRLLMNRLTSIKSVRAVFAHTAKKKPLYLIKRASGK